MRGFGLHIGDPCILVSGACAVAIIFRTTAVGERTILSPYHRTHPQESYLIRFSFFLTTALACNLIQREVATMKHDDTITINWGFLLVLLTAAIFWGAVIWRAGHWLHQHFH
jgi:hypothetical protein